MQLILIKKFDVEVTKNQTNHYIMNKQYTPNIGDKQLVNTKDWPNLTRFERTKR